MKTFKYLGRNKSGILVEDSIESPSLAEATATLKKNNIAIINIKDTSKKFDPSNIQINFNFASKVSKQELQLFCRQMQTLLSSGIPILRAIEQIANNTKNKMFKKNIITISHKLKEGSTFSDAIAGFKNIFSDLFVNLVRVGEKSGNLDTSFAELYKYLELENQSRKKVVSAIRYPIIVIIAIILSVLLMATMVVPHFQKMFASFKTELPLPTKILLGTSYFINNYWYILLIGVIIGIIAFKAITRTPQGKYGFHYLILKTPVIGKTIYKVLVARFCNLLGLLIKSSIPIIDALELAGHSISNDYLQHHIAIICDKVSKGNELSTSLRNENIFPDLMSQMLEIGEETGNLEKMLFEISNYYEREADYELDKLSEAIEPILLSVVGALVLLLSLGVFLPMWDMVSFAKKH